MSTTPPFTPLMALALLSALPASARAEQFVLFDVTFTFTKADADATSSHYFVRELNPAQPHDWTSPVDYRNGKVHVRTEILEKPAGGEVTQWTLCYIPNVGIGQGYGCTTSGTYTEEGVYEREESMTSWWENQSIDWTQGIKEMHLVMKDSNGGNGHVHYRTDPEKFLPTKVRITMVQVSADSTYDPSKVPGLSGDMSDDGAPNPDDDGVTGADDGGDGTVGGADGTVSPGDGDETSDDGTSDGWSSDGWGSDGSGTPSGSGGTGGGGSQASDTSSSGCTVSQNASRSLWAAFPVALGLALVRRRRARPSR